MIITKNKILKVAKANNIELTDEEVEEIIEHYNSDDDFKEMSLELLDNEVILKVIDNLNFWYNEL